MNPADSLDLGRLRQLDFRHRTSVRDPMTQYDIVDRDGETVGVVRLEGEPGVDEVGRLFTDLGTERVRLVVHAPDDTVLFALQRAGRRFAPELIVLDGSGAELGRIAQRNIVGKIRLTVHVGDETVAQVEADSWHEEAFTIQDADGEELAVIVRGRDDVPTTTGVVDRYRLQITRDPGPDVAPLVVASAIAVDAAVHRESL
ncbi:MAG: hypothetical protein M3N57_13165 [Actinomycetota bacterium]|nr:hypothetical protein [Actinomycetota bacterium]